MQPRIFHDRARCSVMPRLCTPWTGKALDISDVWSGTDPVADTMTTQFENIIRGFVIQGLRKTEAHLVTFLHMGNLL